MPSMKLKLLFTFTLFWGYNIFGQIADPIKIELARQNTDTVLLLEKVFLHSDRNNYISGEDLWYKAYLVNAENNRFTAHSN